MEERIKAIYNHCWNNYKQYLTNHDMCGYNQRSEQLMQKYECQADISGLLFWFSGRVQELHDEYEKKKA